MKTQNRYVKNDKKLQQNKKNKDNKDVFFYFLYLLSIDVTPF